MMAQSGHGARKESNWKADAAVFGLTGLFLGASLGHGLWPALSGTVLGLGVAGLRWSRSENDRLRDSISALESQQADFDRRLRSLMPTPQAVPDAPSETQTIDAIESIAGAGVGEARPSVASGQGVSLDEASREVSTSASATSGDSLTDAVDAAFAGLPESDADPGAGRGADHPPTRPAAGPSPLETLLGSVRSFFFGGNTVVRAGLLVLLVGITLLAKYAADNAIFPVEARLASAALLGLGLVGVGYRQREARPGFGMSLQGGGIAALYLVTFFAFKVYGLVPGGLAFALFVALAIATVMLSLLQASEPLVVIGSLGGFLAPILASTGEGNHVVLFSYYLLLNLSIAAVAWRQSWRVPGIVAFVCTYGVATTWGVLRYEAEFFGSTEPFVLAFLALFTGIAVAHAWRRPPELRGMIDGTLVFGTPFVSIMLQSALVHDRELGLALSAAGFGVFYGVVALGLWRTAQRDLRPLAEAFIAIAVGFATMAIPFAFDEALTTSIAWALEGAGLYWVGARQSRGVPRFAGIVLQLLAAFAFWGSGILDRVDSSEFLPLANGRALSCFSLAFAGLFIAQQAYSKHASRSQVETTIAQGLGVWGLLWWTGGLLAEIDQFVEADFQASAILVAIAATAAALEWGAQRSGWEPGRILALVSVPAAGLGFLFALETLPHLLAYGGWVVWPLVFAVFYVLWERMSESESSCLGAFRSGALWLLAIVTAVAAWGLMQEGVGLRNDWRSAAFGAGLGSVLLGCLAWNRRGRSPFDRSPEHAITIGLGPIAAVCLLTTLGLQFAADGDAAPIPHSPLLNPTDLTVALLAVAVIGWWKQVGEVMEEWVDERSQRNAASGLVAFGFIWLNGLLARAVHQWMDVPFNADALWNSTPMQVTLSIAWTLVGLAGMLLSSRLRLRSLWVGCAALLAVVVVKLFTVDLSQLSTVARIVTFLDVGSLLLVLGYFSPVPPSEEEPGSAEADTVPLGERE
jgi:uncharacterized membrane protein